MRIPLDYYRILGLPIQATEEQLKQAHRDRTLQLPRREYSARAIEARKQLIDEAYSVLSDPEQRQSYDTHFLSKSYALEVSAADPEVAQASDEVSVDLGEEALRSLASESASDAYTPTVEINDAQFLGALLILLELGEYELVIRLGRPYLSSGSSSLADERFGEPKTALADIVLSLSLACLELGREQWQQRQYESAAESLETGNELLLREELYPAIRNEIQSELYKLRPYRILELVALPLNHNRERRQGIQLLKAMLQDRGGIDGTEDDLSGLTIDDFLRFTQQLRGYLTSAEQQEIFEAEARRPSSVATYLAIYALLARGFVYHQPALVRRAKKMLVRLGNRQDVHLEQAVCALLLGQTEEASRALELSQEYEPLAFIREQSQGAPDLLPGLCLYAERWLKQEVFPHFRDLTQQQTSLKDYFANEHVQAYLEAMPIEAEAFQAQNGTQAWSRLAAEPTAATASVPASQAAELVGVAADSATFAPSHLPSAQVAVKAKAPEAAPVSVAEQIAQLSPEGRLQPAGSAAVNGAAQEMSLSDAKNVAIAEGASPKRRSPRQRSPHWGRLVLVFLLGILGMGILGFGTMQVLGWIAGLFSGPKLRGEPLAIQLDQPPIAIPDASAIAEQTPGVQEEAAQAISEWLTAKQAALGPNHQIEQLAGALSEPLLTQWRQRAVDAQSQNWHWQYEHSVEVQSVTPEDPDATELTVEAQVAEKGELYEQGELNTNSSYDETLNMRYDLVVEEGEWRVKEMTKLN
ncbi:IMS domain-containing protein [Sphaerothrix gracilis]|uniref:IMS domain-containing protein n=1 Tax=Sphaerothrix gracilis TaxID=3151835 RepID=UPI0031FBC8D0